MVTEFKRAITGPGSYPPLVVLVGPTAIGKTAISLELAQRFHGEVVSADSRLFYRGMDIGTAKPTPLEQRTVPHHLIDITEVEYPLSLAVFQERAFKTIDLIHSRRRLPLLVGGAGQYIWAVVEGWGIPRVSPQPALRHALAGMNAVELFHWLQALDPQAAARIDRRNLRRVIRALEVTLVSGRPISQLQMKTAPPYDITVVGLTCERELLYERIDRRVDDMMSNGLLAEVEALYRAGYNPRLPAISGLGYRQLWTYLEGNCTLQEAVECIKFETHRFARQQYSWFRRDDVRIHWFDTASAGYQDAVMSFIDQRLAP